ncbi:N-acyl homoserine lactonase family protein [Paraburkholderia sp.]|uniref:N-acyl homoserine lactonase family protein n=1 Tax=Paraburkholderia sp. TaxID=1926495 RepID=UPI002F41568D
MTTPGSTRSANETLVKSVSLFNLGTLINDQSSLTLRRGMGTRVEIPVTGAFIEMADGEHILFDTGLLPHDCEQEGTDPCLSMKRFSEMIARYDRQDDIRARLADLGHTPEDVKMVINSHFHWDHSGGNMLFPHARFLVQRTEYRFAYQPDTFVARPYERAYFDCGIHYELLRGDQMIKPGVAVLTTPGHTPGHQSLMLNLPSGAIMIMTGDAVFCPANLDPDMPPGNAHTTEQAIASIARLRLLTEFFGGDLVICHDPDFWKKWQPAPHRYT